MADTPTLSTASTDAEILEAVARWCWWEDRHGADCPAEMIPSEAEFAQFVDALPADSPIWEALQPYHLDRLGTVDREAYRSRHEDAERRWLGEQDAKRAEDLATAEWWATDEGIAERRQRAAGLMHTFKRTATPTPPEVLDTLAQVANWTRADAEGELEATRRRLAAEGEADRETSRRRLEALLSEWREDRLYALGGSFTLEELHVLWQVFRGFEEDRERYPSDEAYRVRPVTPHPLAGPVREWQARPVVGQADRRRTGIQPAPFGWARGDLVPVGDGDDGDRLPEALGPRGARVTQGHLFADLETASVACPWISLVDATGMPIGTRGRGAPLVYRLFTEAQMSVALGARSPGRWLIVPGRDEVGRERPITLREVTEWLYPRWQDHAGRWRGGWKREYLPGVRQAMAQLHNLRIEHDGWEWGLAMFGKLPTAAAQLDDELEFLVRFLPGSERGPLVDREVLRIQGLTSAPRWRLYLRLTYYWDDAKARNGGFRIYASRPVVTRDPEGVVLDQHDKRIFERGGPTRNTFHPKAVRIYDGQRLVTEPNPRVDRLPELGPDDLARMAFDEKLTPSNRRSRIRDARKALRELEAAGLVAVLEGSNGGVRIAEVYREPTELTYPRTLNRVPAHTEPRTRAH